MAGQEGRRRRIRGTHPVARVAGVADGDAGRMRMLFSAVVSDVRGHDIQGSVLILKTTFN